MPIRYKIDLLAALKEAGFTTYKIRQGNWPLNQNALQRIREGKMIAWEQLDNVCEVLQRQPGDIVEHVAQSPQPNSAAPRERS